MQKTILTLFLMLQIGVIYSQNINLTELVPGPSFPDARNGSIAKGDIDNDGDMDLLISGKNGNILHSSLYINSGNGNFTLSSGTPFVAINFGDTEFEDVDRDGDLDLLITGSDLQAQAFASLYLNNGFGVFTLAANTPFEPSFEGDIAFEDIDNDGDKDLMMVGYNAQGNGFSTMYSNNGFGVFTQLSSSNFVPARDGAIAFIDYDNDGDKDLIIAGTNNAGSAQTVLYQNNGSGVFTPVSNTSFIGIRLGDIGVADTDNDGDEDVILSGNISGSLNTTNLYLNDNAGNFILQPNTSFPSVSLGTAEFADFDMDGDQDLLITGSIGLAEFAGHIFENTGGNNFVLADTIEPAYLTSAAIADIDGDSDPDMVIAGITNAVNSFKTRTYINSLNTVGIYEPVQAGSNLNVYPNPSYGAFNISSNLKVISSVKVHDILGRLIFNSEANSNELKLDLKSFPPGFYILETTYKDMKKTAIRIIKK